MDHLKSPGLHALAKIGANIQAQRERVFKESLQQFAQRLSRFGPPCGEREARALEAGDPDLPMGHYAAAFQAMQCLAAVADATKNDAALYMAAMELPEGVEAEMLARLNRENRGGGA